MKPYRHKAVAILSAAAIMAMTGCYSNNCPLETTVRCNYHFYDSQGNAATYIDTITVTTLKPGHQTVYVYRKLGNPTLTKNYQDTALVNQGYTETTTIQRKDTVLLNQLSGASSCSLPMSYFNEVDTLIFSYRMISLKDTIKVSHESFPYVDYPECGSHRFHRLTDVQSTEAAIDHIEIDNPNVNYDGNENIKIYFNGVVE